MKPVPLLCALLLATLPAAAEEPRPPPDKVDQEFLRRMVTAPPLRFLRPRFEHDYDCPKGPPSWALSRMFIVVPDGTPQLVYRAPSAARCSPDF